MRNGTSKRKVPTEDGQKVERYEENRDAQMQDEGNEGQDHAMYRREFHEWRRVTSGASIEAAQKVLTLYSGDGRKRNECTERQKVHLRDRSLESTDAGRSMVRGAAEGGREGEEERRKGWENGREQ